MNAGAQGELAAEAEALRASEQRYRTLFNAMDEGYCLIEMVYDAGGRACDYRFLDTNPAFDLQTGLTNAVGRRIREMVPNFEMSWVDTYAAIARTGTPMRFESESPSLGIYFDVYATRVDSDGRVAILFKDITAKRRGEDDLRIMAAALSEVDRRKNEFLATLAHELRNPLAPLSNGLSVVRQLRDDAPALADAVGMMERQVQHMVRLVDDLLDVARISNGKVELKRAPVNVGAVLALAVESSMHLISEKGHTLHQRVGAAAVVLDIDGERIAQVVSNLINNAAKYSPAGSPITLTADINAGAVVITVVDEGIGIPAQSLGTVFDMFSQVAHASTMAQGGLGIGLSLVRKLVELHGGSVAVTSGGIDRGSEFSVRLPLRDGDAAAGADGLAPALAPAGAHARAAVTAPPRARRILVVDDNRDAADTLAMLLDFAGHVTSVRYDGVAALAHAGSFRPHVVFLDIGLPGMNGYEVARAIKAQPALAGTVLVALTGWGAEADRDRALAAGFDHHLTKPTHIDVLTALIARIDAALDARAAPPAA